MPNLFVYGSLRNGFFNHHLLGLAGASRFEKMTRLTGARLYRRGRYPAVFLTGLPEDTVEGEIYVDVDRRVFEIIQSLELSSGFVEAEVVLEGFLCTIFVFPQPGTFADLVPSGSWRDARPTLNIGVVIFPGVEEFDFLGALKVFKNWSGGREYIFAFTVSEATPGSLIRCSGGLLAYADFCLPDTPRIDLLTVPGGPGRQKAINTPRLADFIHECSKTAILVLDLNAKAPIASEEASRRDEAGMIYLAKP